MQAIRHQYESHGSASAYYKADGSRYQNPHEERVRSSLRLCVQEWGLNISRVLDLACGSGEVTLEIRELGGMATGVDPFTGQAYKSRTGQEAENVDFAAIAAGAISGRRYSLVVCSYALHLAEPSRLPLLLYRLSEITDHLLVLSPHKKPFLGTGPTRSCVVGRVHARLYSLPLVSTP